MKLEARRANLAQFRALSSPWLAANTIASRRPRLRFIQNAAARSTASTLDHGRISPASPILNAHNERR
jgi:hypothetical protein